MKSCEDSHPRVWYDTAQCPLCSYVFERNHAIVDVVQAREELSLALERLRKALDRITCTCNPETREVSEVCVVHSPNREQILNDVMGRDVPVRRVPGYRPGRHGPRGPNCRCEGIGGGINRRITRWNPDCTRHPEDPNKQEVGGG